jgi:hypothetical protein
MARWTKGQSGNRKGRPKSGIAIAELARGQVARHKLIEKLGRIGARLGDTSRWTLTSRCAPFNCCWLMATARRVPK